MNKQIGVFAALIAFLAVPFLAASQGSGRGVLFQLGAGAGFPSYPGQAEAAFSYLDSMPGVDRLKLSLDVALGAAISQQAYFMARIDGIGDRIYDSSTWVQMNLYLFSAGLRYYPSVTGFYVEAGAGASKAVAQSSLGTSSSSDFGFGYGAAVGYDLNADAKGFGLTLEAKYDNLSISGEQAGAFMLTLNLCWK